MVTIGILELTIAIIRNQYFVTPLTILSEISISETSFELQHVLKQAGEALTLPIKVPAKKFKEALAKEQLQSPSKTSFLPANLKINFDFDFAHLGFDAIFTFKQSKRKTSKSEAKGNSLDHKLQRSDTR